MRGTVREGRSRWFGHGERVTANEEGDTPRQGDGRRGQSRWRG